MKRVTWPVALVVVALLGAVTLLGALGRPVTELISLGAMIIGALLYGEVRGVREQTNGAQTKLIDALTQKTVYDSLRSGRDPYVPDGGNHPEVPR